MLPHEVLERIFGARTYTSKKLHYHAAHHFIPLAINLVELSKS
jgi:hypothetical protein